MKYQLKSAKIKSLLMLACLVGLAACEQTNNIQWPHVFNGNEVPPDVANAPSAVTVDPPNPNETWPRLGDVPSKPNDFSSPLVIQQTKRDMQTDRQQAETIKDEVHTPPVLQPPPIQ
jgi:hypothetical protein